MVRPGAGPRDRADDAAVLLFSCSPCVAAAVSTSYRSVEWVLLSRDRAGNAHLRRLLGAPPEGGLAKPGGEAGGGEGAPRRPPEDFSRAGGDEPWAREFTRLLVEDPTFTNLACMKSKQLKKELVEGVACVARVEEALGRIRGRRAGLSAELERTGEGLLVVDLCSGKGAAGLMLALRFPSAVVRCVDLRPPAEKDLHEGVFENVERVTGDVYDDALIERVFASKAGYAGVCVLLGMHLCGDLSRRAVEIFDTREAVDCALVAPCCLQRQVAKRLRPANSWGYDTTELARKAGMEPIVLWLQRLLEASSAAPQAKRIWNDTDMLSVRNAFVEMYRGGVDIATGA